MNIGSRIQKHRAKSGLSQEGLAEKLGVTRQSVSKWELGQALPEADKIVAMSKLFQTTTDELLIDEDPVCQSCAMFMVDDSYHGANAYGTNEDGSPNKDYCKYCFVKGKFGKPDETMEEMIETCIPFRLNFYPDAETARAEMLKHFPTLKRWKTAEV